ncbi:MAG: triose-phosphate isomerase [Candidatus Algichlamydia australiensis]|nr:triose-phosphate isomerase [Chlamydiales bacterium]
MEPIIIANWKMHKTHEEARSFIEGLKPLIAGKKAWIASPFTAISSAVVAAEGSEIMIGAQNMHDALQGAFTGQISASMLKAHGVKFVLLGHSECRHIFNESDDLIRRKLERALMEGLIPVLCIGETLKERESDQTHAVLRRQLMSALEGTTDFTPLIVAYEPVWAIGTGKVASPELAQEAHLTCRKILAELSSEQVAASIPILYGGSVKPENIAGLLAQPDVEGALVGGASLDVNSYHQLLLGGTT